MTLDKFLIRLEKREGHKIDRLIAAYDSGNWELYDRIRIELNELQETIKFAKHLVNNKVK